MIDARHSTPSLKEGKINVSGIEPPGKQWPPDADSRPVYIRVRRRELALSVRG
jgi:hypothetical protein